MRGFQMKGCCCGSVVWREFYSGIGLVMYASNGDPDETNTDYGTALLNASHLLSRYSSTLFTGEPVLGWESGKWSVDATDLFLSELEKFDNNTYPWGDYFGLRATQHRHPFAGPPLVSIETISGTNDEEAHHLCTFDPDADGTTPLVVGIDVMSLMVTLPAEPNAPSGSTLPPPFPLSDVISSNSGSPNNISQLTMGADGVHRYFTAVASGGTPTPGDSRTFAYTLVVSDSGAILKSSEPTDVYVNATQLGDRHGLLGLATARVYSDDNAPRAVGTIVETTNSDRTYKLAVGDAESGVIGTPTVLDEWVLGITETPPVNHAVDTAATGFEAEIYSGGAEFVTSRLSNQAERKAWLNGGLFAPITHDDLTGSWNLPSPAYERAPTRVEIDAMIGTSTNSRPRVLDVSPTAYHYHNLRESTVGPVISREITGQAQWYTGRIIGISVLTGSNDVMIAYNETAAVIRHDYYTAFGAPSPTARLFEVTNIGPNKWGEPGGWSFANSEAHTRIRLELYRDGVLQHVTRREDPGVSPSPIPFGSTPNPPLPRGLVYYSDAPNGGSGDIEIILKVGLENGRPVIFQRNDRYWYVYGPRLEGFYDTVPFAISAEGDYHLCSGINNGAASSNSIALEVSPFSTIEQPIPTNAKSIAEDQ